jgi:hypothetical protein
MKGTINVLLNKFQSSIMSLPGAQGKESLADNHSDNECTI